jgi:hypothetical protein
VLALLALAMPQGAASGAASSGWAVQSTPVPQTPNGQLSAVACSSSPACTAVGYFINAKGVQQTLAEFWNGSKWATQTTPNPSGATSSLLYGVSCGASTACTAVGEFATSPGLKPTTALVEVWNGTSWAIQATPGVPGAASSVLSGVSCTAAAACTAVGTYTTTASVQLALAERWDGTSWAVQSTPKPSGSVFNLLAGVSCVAATMCTAVGSYIETPSGATVTLAETWHGTNWTIQSTPNPSGATNSALSGVSCAVASACTATGNSETSSGQSLTLAERWSGTKWTIQTTPNPTSSRVSVLSSVSCATTTACTAVGTSLFSAVALVEHWDGTNWTIQTVPTPASSVFTEQGGVACTAVSACIAVGGFAATSSGFYAGSQATTAERWNGTTWKIQKTRNPTGAAPSSLEGVSCATASACIAVGSYSVTGTTDQLTLAEHWDGTHWTIQSTANPSGAAADAFAGVSCATAMVCDAVGSSDRGPLAEGWDGTNWTIQATPTPSGSTSSQLSGVSCTGAGACTAVGSYIGGTGATLTLAERWDGVSWTIQATPTPSGATSSQLSGVSCLAAGTCTAAGSYVDSSGVTMTLAESWNGISWAVQTTPNPPGASSSQLSGVFCSAAAACTAVGSDHNGSFLTLAERWDGTGWTIQSTPTPSFSGFGGDSCAGAAACDAVGSVFAEAWDGTTWATQPLAVPSGRNLSSLTGVACTTPTACTAAGSSNRFFQIGFAYSFGSQALVTLPLAENHP